MTDTILNIPPIYDHEKHLYTLNGGRYWSATQVVQKFYEQFDTKEQATRYAAKNGGTPEQWMRIWKEKNDISKHRGNRIHDANELVLHQRGLDVIDGAEVPVFTDLQIEDRYPWIERPDGVYTERTLWHHGYRVAGRADKIILQTPIVAARYPNTILADYRFAHIEDYKTNERLDKVSFQYRNGDHKMMKPPIAHLMDCNWTHYCLQLSIYMFMLEYQGFRPGNIRIIYYPHEGEKEYHSVPYMKKEVILMLTYLNR